MIVFHALQVFIVSGIAMVATAPLAGRLMRVLDRRVRMGLGFAGFAVGTWMITGITADWDFRELFVPQILRGMSLMICMVPIDNGALGMLPPQMNKNASGLYNLTRNLGSAAGLAVINTALVDRQAFHHECLAESMTWSHDVVNEARAAAAGGGH